MECWWVVIDQTGLLLMQSRCVVFRWDCSTSWDYSNIKFLFIIESVKERHGWNETYLFWTPSTLSNVLAVFQPRKNFVDGSLFLFQFLHLQTLTTSASLLGQCFLRLLDELDVFYPQLFWDNVQVSCGVNVAFDVCDLGIVETSHNLEDSIDCSDVWQESITKTSTRWSASRQTSDIVDC